MTTNGGWQWKTITGFVVGLDSNLIAAVEYDKIVGVQLRFSRRQGSVPVGRNNKRMFLVDFNPQ
jgi:hypothetical protein